MATLTHPFNGFEEIELSLEHYIYTSNSQGGYSTEIRYAEPLWRGSLTSTVMDQQEFQEAEEFINEASERMLAFDLVHPLFLCPRSYTVSTTPGGGTASVVGISDLTAPHISGFTNGLLLKKGDRVSVEEGDYVSYRVIASDVTVSSTTDQTINIRPRLPVGRFTTAATLRYLNPKVRLRVVPNTWSVGLQGGQPIQGSFDVIEAPR